MANVKGIHRYCSLSKFDASILFAYTLVTFVKTYHHEGARGDPTYVRDISASYNLI